MGFGSVLVEYSFSCVMYCTAYCIGGDVLLACRSGSAVNTLSALRYEMNSCMKLRKCESSYFHVIPTLMCTFPLRNRNSYLSALIITMPMKSSSDAAPVCGGTVENRFRAKYRLAGYRSLSDYRPLVYMKDQFFPSYHV
jgi:hypothetical protein